MESTDLIHRLRKRAEIRRSIKTRKSVQSGEPDRIADLLEEAANAITNARIDLLEELANSSSDSATQAFYIILANREREK